LARWVLPVRAETERESPAHPPPIAARHPLLSWLIGLLRSFGFAFAGVGALLRSQRNAQIHAVATIVVVAAAAFFGVSSGEWIALILAIALVIALEGLNTALEAVVDLLSPMDAAAAKADRPPLPARCSALPAR
jgi:diacylglycerol kinase